MSDVTQSDRPLRGQSDSRPSEQKWWAVTRRYTIEERVLVRAESAYEAKERARDGDYEDIIGSWDVVSDTTYRKATLIPGGKPRAYWNTADYEAEGDE